MEWVVRGGQATPLNLINSYARHAAMPQLFGFSVQYAPGKTVDALARAGRLPNLSISYAEDTSLEAALTPLGYSMRLVRSPGKGYHHTFTVLYDVAGTMLKILPQDAAEAISRTFKRIPNPAVSPSP